MEDTAILNASDFLDAEDPRLSFLIGNIRNAVTNRANQLAGQYGLTIRQLLVIGYLQKHSGEMVTQKTLEDHMHLSNPTITVLIQNMMKKGLIRREKVPEDGRKYRLILTEKALSIMGPCSSAMLADDAVIYSIFTEEEKRQLMSLLERLEQHLAAMPHP